MFFRLKNSKLRFAANSTRQRAVGLICHAQGRVSEGTMKSQVYDTVKSKQKVAFQSRFRDGRTLSRTGGNFFFSYFYEFFL